MQNHDSGRSWQERIWTYQRTPYHQDICEAIELLTRAFEEQLGLIPRMGKEWEFMLSANDKAKLHPREIGILVKSISEKINEVNANLRILGRGGGYDRFYPDYQSESLNYAPILEITTQAVSPLRSAQLIDLFQRMLKERQHLYGYGDDIFIAKAQKNGLCALHDNISFFKKDMLDHRPVYPPKKHSDKWTEITDKVLEATPPVMLLFAPYVESYERFTLLRSSLPPEKISYGMRASSADDTSHAYCHRINQEREPDKNHIENRLPDGAASPFEVTIGTLLVFFNAMREKPIECGPLQNKRAGMGSLNEAKKYFEQLPLLKNTLNELDPMHQIGTIVT